MSFIESHTNENALTHQTYLINYFQVHSTALLFTLTAKDGDLRLSAPNACLPKTEISVFVTKYVFFASTCYKLHMFTLHDVLYS